jgi:serine/threonine-protein kinase
MHEATRLNEQIYGMQDVRTALSLNNLGAILYQSGRYDEAYSEYQKADPIYRIVYGDSHPEVATLLNNMGRSALMAGHVDEAELLLRQALAVTEKFVDPDHDYLVAPLTSLAMIDAYRGRLDEARREIQRAQAIARLPDHGELLDQVLLTEADLELASGNRARATALLAESKGLLQKAHADDAANAWRYAVWDAVNAQLLAANGDSAGAARMLAGAQPIITQRFGPLGFYSLLAQRRAQLISSPPKG